MRRAIGWRTRQILRGTASGSEIQGLLVSRGVPVYAGGTAVGNSAVQLFQAINGCRSGFFTEPEWVVMHPGRLRADALADAQHRGSSSVEGPWPDPLRSVRSV